MEHIKQGTAPGIDAPIGKAAGVSQDSKRLRADTSNAINIIALYERTKQVIVRFASWLAMTLRVLS